MTRVERDPAIAQLAERALALAVDGRAVLGITGSPGAGKTTLAVDLVAAVDALAGEVGTAVHLSMDGFHLAESTLRRLGRLDRKGAIDTFDGHGFVALLRRIRSETGNTIYAPGFDRRLEEPIAGEIAIEPSVRLVVVEGLYLLADAPPWDGVRGLLDEAWFCATDEPERLRRLVSRHIVGGRTPEAATAWATGVDGGNARLVAATASRADLVVSGVDRRVLRD